MTGPTIAARINPSTFPAQVVAAGLGGLAYSCNPSGVFCAPGDADALRPVVAAHNPDAAPPVVAPVPTCTKLGLVRAFKERGWWPSVRALIASKADFQEEWDLATELRVSDPIVQEAIAGLAAAGLPMTDADVLALIARANELVV